MLKLLMHRVKNIEKRSNLFTFFYVLIYRMNNNKENKMKLRAKIAILIIAVMITFVGFNLLVPSSALELMDAGQDTGYEVTCKTVATYTL